jgi:hypothetical protein
MCQINKLHTNTYKKEFSYNTTSKHRVHVKECIVTVHYNQVNYNEHLFKTTKFKLYVIRLN